MSTELALPSSTPQLVRELQTAHLEKIKSACCKWITPERVLSIVGSALRRNPDLMQCSPVSFLNAVVTSARLGLDCSGVLNQGHLVKYGSECVFIPGFGGLMTLAKRSGAISNAWVGAVFTGDAFAELGGNVPNIHHEVKHTCPETFDNLVATYCCWEVPGSAFTMHAAMRKGQVEAIRKKARAKGGPWADPYDAVEMAKKSAVRRAAKQWIMSTDDPALTEAIGLADQHEGIDVVSTSPEATDLRASAQSKSVADRLSQAAAKAAATDARPPQQVGEVPDAPLADQEFVDSLNFGA